MLSIFVCFTGFEGEYSLYLTEKRVKQAEIDSTKMAAEVFRGTHQAKNYYAILSKERQDNHIMKKSSSFLNPIAILDVLKEHSDESNALTAAQIRDLVNKKSGEAVISKVETVKNILDRLMDEATDYVVESTSGPGREKYYLERDLSLPEIIFLINQVQSAYAITKSQNNELVKKLKHMLSKKQRSILSKRVLFGGGQKTPNAHTFLNIELIADAFAENVKLKFNYMVFNMEKQLEERGGQRTVIPYRILTQGGHNYLLAKGDDNIVKAFRIDKIKNIRLADIKLSKEEKREVEAYDAEGQVRKSAFMYIGGHADYVELKCDNHPDIINAIAENFPDARITPNADGSFNAVLWISPRGFVYWALQYSTVCEVVSPAYLREEIHECLTRASSRYEDN